MSDEIESVEEIVETVGRVCRLRHRFRVGWRARLRILFGADLAVTASWDVNGPARVAQMAGALRLHVYRADRVSPTGDLGPVDKPKAEPLGDVVVNRRGFEYLRFQDRYDVTCSLQQSSLATEGAIWLGYDGNPPPSHGGVRMHLTERHVRGLIRHLQSWLETGSFRWRAAESLPDAEE